MWRRICRTNLKGIGTSCSLYAASNNDSLFAGTTPFTGSWMCDQPKNLMGGLVGTTLPPGGGEPRRFYCPANADQDVSTLWGFSPFTITGYAWTSDRSSLPDNKMPPLDGLRKAPPLMYHQTMTKEPDQSRTELAWDWIISPTTAGATWGGVTDPGRPGVYATSDMKGQMPAGANVLCFDTHVEWRPFVKGNATPIPQGGGAGAPVFWLPNP